MLVSKCAVVQVFRYNNVDDEAHTNTGLQGAVGSFKLSDVWAWAFDFMPRGDAFDRNGAKRQPHREICSSELTIESAPSPARSSLPVWGTPFRRHAALDVECKLPT